MTPALRPDGTRARAVERSHPAAVPKERGRAASAPHERDVAALLSRAKAGDHRAVNDLLLHVASFVTQLCVPIAREHSADAAQDAMLAIFRGVQGLRDPTAFYGWVRAVTVREAVRTSNRLKQTGTPTDVLPDLVQDANPLVAVHISDVMERLPDHHRQILTLRAVYGLSEQEMAATLGLPVGTVRSRLHRARRSFDTAWHRCSA
ncbi:RNA polymerase sigma factor [Kitasatospora herbaricolor]|uniref:RNA polymerase sigma factor n=1 Tax=Kitasatospora herbaricolor TaxID=68217 RepID=UPI00174CBF95|nr:RNA polymerase sigma factor [Kitasatospora herbaricolor]MDQ0306069.1 RNA polymerase sigma-70 factor (ECF subfamily) [Kitasatospora herbaricolor]GGV23535.1 RNA polymerase sigma factor [Kitasatospora herbaricolor]